VICDEIAAKFTVKLFTALRGIRDRRCRPAE
jgi:hypothetical protein